MESSFLKAVKMHDSFHVFFFNRMDNICNLTFWWNSDMIRSHWHRQVLVGSARREHQRSERQRRLHLALDDEGGKRQHLGRKFRSTNWRISKFWIFPIRIGSVNFKQMISHSFCTFILMSLIWCIEQIKWIDVTKISHFTLWIFFS